MRRFIYALLLCLACSLNLPRTTRSPRKPSSLFLSSSFGSSGTQLSHLRRPSGICADVAGNIWVADSGNQRISKWDKNGRAISEYRGDMVGRFEDPKGIASDGFRIYVADAKKRSVVRVDPESHQSVVISHGLTQKVTPWGIEGTSTGEVYVSDRENSRILIFDGTGRLRGSFGRYGGSPGEFRKPYGIGVDEARSVYVCDVDRKVIEVFDPLGGHLYSIGCELPPIDLDMDYHGNLFVASPTRITVLREKAAIVVEEGPRNPGGILVKDERVYVTDMDSDRVLVFDIVYSDD